MAVIGLFIPFLFIGLIVLFILVTVGNREFIPPIAQYGALSSSGARNGRPGMRSRQRPQNSSTVELVLIWSKLSSSAGGWTCYELRPGFVHYGVIDAASKRLNSPHAFHAESARRAR